MAKPHPLGPDQGFSTGAWKAGGPAAPAPRTRPVLPSRAQALHPAVSHPRPWVLQALRTQEEDGPSELRGPGAWTPQHPGLGGPLLVLRLRRKGLTRSCPSRCKSGSLTSGPLGKPQAAPPSPDALFSCLQPRPAQPSIPDLPAPQAMKPGVPQPWALSRGQSSPRTHHPDGEQAGQTHASPREGF